VGRPRLNLGLVMWEAIVDFQVRSLTLAEVSEPTAELINQQWNYQLSRPCASQSSTSKPC